MAIAGTVALALGPTMVGNGEFDGPQFQDRLESSLEEPELLDPVPLQPERLEPVRPEVVNDRAWLTESSQSIRIESADGTLEPLTSIDLIPKNQWLVGVPLPTGETC